MARDVGYRTARIVKAACALQGRSHKALSRFRSRQDFVLGTFVCRRHVVDVDKVRVVW